VANAKFRRIKPEIRILGIDDGSFKPHGGGRALLVGVVFRGGQQLDGILSTEVEVDGVDATDKIVEMINQSSHKGQLRVVMMEGVTFAGFNVVDIREIFRRTGLPVVVVSRKLPNKKRIREALKHLPDWKERWAVIQKSGKIHQMKFGRGKLYLQVAGIELADAQEVVSTSSLHGSIPEPVRVAHLIASGIAKGSQGRE
jgi:hypothetical protein